MSNSSEPSLLRDFSFPAVVAGLVAALVSYAGPLVVVIQAARAAQLSDERLASWIWAISIGSGLVGIVLSLRYRMPILAAWSTPGAALLVTGLAEYRYAEAVGAYLVAGVLTVLAGLSGVLTRLMARIPVTIAAAMLAGILLRYGLGAFGALSGAPLLASVMILTYVVARRLLPRYALALTLATGVLTSAVTTGLHLGGVRLNPAVPLWTTPQFSAAALVGLALPLFVVTMTSQNAPGFAVLNAAGYHPPAGRVVLATGVASVALAPFGSPGINVAAITAAICAGPDAHPDPRRRYVAGLSTGFWYLLVGSVGMALAQVFLALPSQLVALMAGIALLGPLLNGLAGAFAEPRDRESALITFLVSGSGITVLGLAAPFWGLVLGILAHLILTRRRVPGQTPHLIPDSWRRR
ncbi:benzoate membrane transport protein [Actinoplanes campanulatus]|uniref:Benzoate membrane transport protein n=1 Tax=Actinoplanes campanulatus TaxID=113559 RepID=A0A7W5ALQ2_9ACTN|nr:benzoate/H(+) symporter BenE family transporter [Actinoplanes campanulatus]MBB3098179.1 benzoate membrane transport protein [Actinoplanes campanulatus]GGN32782.1 transporter [Actinoplanes campanulatus]GID39947.1 transporter [Actinoplanes campanulatus]